MYNLFIMYHCNGYWVGFMGWAAAAGADAAGIVYTTT